MSTQHNLARGAVAINKPILIIIAVLLALILGGELWLTVLEEIADLAFEWTHKVLDLMYAEVFGLEHEKAAKASAWTGLFLLVGVLGGGGYIAYKKFLLAKAAAPQWWAKQKAEFKVWWAGLPWLHKLAYLAALVGMLGFLAMLI